MFCLIFCQSVFYFSNIKVSHFSDFCGKGVRIIRDIGLLGFGFLGFHCIKYPLIEKHHPFLRVMGRFVALVPEHMFWVRYPFWCAYQGS